ncbi:MAG: DNA mismatch repair protein MutS [Desulfovibrio sp.]|nr:DNA mismatch repair protein MutS [Desulfovibrio sp.]
MSEVAHDEQLTPMFRQYQSIKKSYPDALLFFHLGDFFELFFEDALIASKELQLTLTRRGKGTKNEAPMCGVPHHASQSYIAQLVDRGYSVAICEQVEDPKKTKDIVKRAVTAVITPGTILDETALGLKSHNFLGAVVIGLNDSCGFAWADISTGQWSGIEFRRQASMWQWVQKLAPRELLIMDGQHPPAGFNAEGIRLVRQPAIKFELRRATERLLQAQGVKEVGALGLEDKPGLTRACGAILAYLDSTQAGAAAQLMPFQPLDPGKRLLIDEFTERNLEIFKKLNGQKGKGTLRHLLDQTITPMGGRLLEDMLRHPFRELRPIRQIQEAVRWFFLDDAQRGRLRASLADILDLERIIMRICLGRARPRDFFSLRQTLEAIPKITEQFYSIGLSNLPGPIALLLNNLSGLEDLAKWLGDALADEPPQGAGIRGMFKKEFNAALAEQCDLLEHGEERLAELEARDRKESGIAKLRLGYNRVFGYYYEAPRSSLKNGLPDRFVRRQSLANAERFSTEELKQLEEDILAAEERRSELENELYGHVAEHVAAQKSAILQVADMLAQLDYWQNLAEVGRRENWTMPELDDSGEIHIIEGRHPVVESIIGAANFVPNDFHMDAERRLCLITGPNMAGKSTVLRQIAIICLLAQMGSPVPAEQARLGIVDRLFSRVGASDNLAQGQSTFMVEMMETARILRQATRRSLIILDEIGRGTSTYDGMAIAWAVAEDLASRCQRQLRTLFATHYHELTALENQIAGVFTMNITVGSYDNREILFLHRLVPGPADKSYGVEVARMAGIPYPVVQRARAILAALEQTKTQAPALIGLPGLTTGKIAKNAGICARLAKLDLESITPEAALAILRELQQACRDA